MNRYVSFAIFFKSSPGFSVILIMLRQRISWNALRITYCAKPRNGSYLYHTHTHSVCNRVSIFTEFGLTEKMDPLILQLCVVCDAAVFCAIDSTNYKSLVSLRTRKWIQYIVRVIYAHHQKRSMLHTSGGSQKNEVSSTNECTSCFFVQQTKTN